MDRKGIIAITISVITIFVWQNYYTKEMQKYTAAQDARKAADKAAEAAAKAKAEALNPVPADTASAVPGTSAAPASGPAAQPAPETPVVHAQTEEITSPLVDYTFTNLGGGISRAVLLKHLAESGSMHEDGRETKVTLNEFSETPIGAVFEQIGENARQPYVQTANPQAGEVLYERTDARQLQTTKKFSVPRAGTSRDEYLVGLDLTFANRGQQPIQVGGYYVSAGSAGPIHRMDQSIYTGFDWYTTSNNFKAVSSFSSGGVLWFGRVDQPVFSQSAPNVGWAAVTNQYFSTIVIPEKAKGAALWAQKFPISAIGETPLPGNTSAAEKNPLLAVEGALGMPGFSLAPGQSVAQHFDIFAGPRAYERLKALGGDEDEILDFGMFKIVSKGLLASMNWLHDRFGSYAAAIIILTLIIRSFMWPLQNKSTESMKKMQLLTPKMNELKAKYQDDPQRMNQEVMKLYKEYGVNPLSGCLPMVIQIPIFWGLFRMLGKAVELRNSHFLWIHDLSQPDTVAMIMGKPLNILPLIMAVTSFLQMRLTPKSGDASQQKMFMFMPLIFVFFCYNYASALALYWTVQNIFTIGQLYVTRNKTTPVLQKISGGFKKKVRG